MSPNDAVARSVLVVYCSVYVLACTRTVVLIVLFVTVSLGRGFKIL